MGRGDGLRHYSVPSDPRRYDGWVDTASLDWSLWDATYEIKPTKARVLCNVGQLTAQLIVSTA